jgi:MFS family permease
MFPIGNLLSALTLDRISRRWTMIWGCAGLSICMIMLAALLSTSEKAPASAAIAFFFLYTLIFGGTINVVPWGKIIDAVNQEQQSNNVIVYGLEILPLEARTRGTAMSVSAY